MLKISVTTRSDDGSQLHLEGRLVGPWVEELRRLSNEALARQETLTLDMERVWFVDAQGVALLRDLSERNVTQLNCSPFISQQLKEMAYDDRDR